jgi:copper(I)-binding protein
LISQASVARTIANLGLTTLVTVCFIPATNAQQADFRITIENAWVRAMPPTQSSTAGYLTVHNHGDSPVEIVAASSQPVANVEMHNSTEVNGLMSMERMHTLSLSARTKVEFTPGGKHLMIMGLEKMPAPGDTVELCLEFDTGRVVCTQADVRRTAPGLNDDDGTEHQHH